MGTTGFPWTKKKISHRHYIGPLRGSSSPFSTLSRRGLNPIKPVYDQDRPLADSYVAGGAREAGSAEELAAARKEDKYSSIDGRYLFEPLRYRL